MPGMKCRFCNREAIVYYNEIPLCETHLRRKLVQIKRLIKELRA
ncbi:MAG: hypothetical protein ACE5Z5_12535 [Candidatus Bathyarchaeia archaeon]